MKMKIRRMAAIWIAKVISAVCRLSGKQGVTFAGKIALKVDPDILKDLSAQVREKIFVVCGTNGKTTTNNLLCSAIEKEVLSDRVKKDMGNISSGQDSDMSGYSSISSGQKAGVSGTQVKKRNAKVVCNHTGSNMLDGVVAAFVLAAGNSGTLDADYACIEIDEASTLRVFPHFKPDYMVLTNLFRDQLDRYGEIDITMDMLNRAMAMAPDMKIIVNADDALAAYLAMESGHEYLTYGITERVFSEEEQGEQHEIREGRFCKKCGTRLEYEFYHYSQLGKYSCPNCGFARPAVDFEAFNIDMSEGLSFEVLEKLENISLSRIKEDAGNDNEAENEIDTENSFDTKNSVMDAARLADTVPNVEKIIPIGTGKNIAGKAAAEKTAANKNVSDRKVRRYESRPLSADYHGFYNIYNILAAYAAGRSAGLAFKSFDEVLSSFHPQNGRMEHFHIGRTDVVLNLAKNPAGFNQNISAVMEDKREKDIIIVINDNAQDGTDISWLWDVDFDRFGATDHTRQNTDKLASPDSNEQEAYGQKKEMPTTIGKGIHSITVSGIRCQDMRLRMKYVDIPCDMIGDVKTAIEARLADGCGNLYVLVNYTALFSTRNILAGMG
ncbi:MAG: MurT ligase domain-containing protein [Lachnospiraceae bacterium]|nr:MurT ligase domain-containing protein [Lachnospiraceae bacterium]